MAGRSTGARSRNSSTDTLQSYESDEIVLDYVTSGDFTDENTTETKKSSHPKTPSGVKRLPTSSVDATTNDIFSPANISQGACLDKFGYAPGEIVNKLFLEVRAERGANDTTLEYFTANHING